jgi:hypothetical protein
LLSRDQAAARSGVAQFPPTRENAPMVVRRKTRAKKAASKPKKERVRHAAERGFHALCGQSAARQTL